MSERKATRKQMYELSPDVIGKTTERVTRQMRKSVPEEYNELLKTAIEDTHVMVRERWEKAARLYVRRLYDILRNNDYSPFNARVVVETDCNRLWSKEYVNKYIPSEAHDQKKINGGKATQAKRKIKVEQELKEIKDEVKDVLPDATDEDAKILKKHPKLKVGMAAASKEIRTRVATSGGDGKFQKYGPDAYSEMGQTGARNRYTTLQLVINNEEHLQLETAYRTSLAKRRDGEGSYTIWIESGEFSKVVPILESPNKKLR